MSIIDDLLVNTPEPQRKALEKIRRRVLALCPDAKEVQSYGMPGFSYRGKYLLAFANFKDHMSLFPGAEPIETFAKDLTAYKTSKGTIQFSVEQPLNDELLDAIIASCMNRIDNAAGSR